MSLRWVVQGSYHLIIFNPILIFYSSTHVFYSSSYHLLPMFSSCHLRILFPRGTTPIIFGILSLTPLAVASKAHGSPERPCYLGDQVVEVVDLLVVWRRAQVNIGWRETLWVSSKHQSFFSILGVRNLLCNWGTHRRRGNSLGIIQTSIVASVG